jgi:hypothetical protein
VLCFPRGVSQLAAQPGRDRVVAVALTRVATAAVGGAKLGARVGVNIGVHLGWV